MLILKKDQYLCFKSWNQNDKISSRFVQCPFPELEAKTLQLIGQEFESNSSNDLNEITWR